MGLAQPGELHQFGHGNCYAGQNGDLVNRRAQKLFKNLTRADEKDGVNQQEKDKRATRRFALRLPVRVRYGENGQERETQTRDVSARGVCFYLDSEIQAGSGIDFTLTLPPEITLTESIRVRCRGRVLRVEGGTTNGKMAVAAVIDEYEFLADT